MSEWTIYPTYPTYSPIDHAADSPVQNCRKDASYHESAVSRDLLLTNISRFVFLTFLLLIAMGEPVSAAGNPGLGDPCGPVRDACSNETVTDPFAGINAKLKPAEAAALKSRIQNSLHAFSNNQATDTWYARNAANRITFSYTGDGIGEFTGSDTAFGLSLNGIGRDGTLVPVTSGVVRASGRQLEIARPGYTEWYRNNDNGVEQGLTITGRPTGTGPVQVRFLLSGNLTLTPLDSRTLAVCDAAGKPLFEYTGLKAFDADGRDLPATLATDGPALSWVVDDSHAVYPITIDPVVVSASDVTARFTGGAAEDWFGYSVALSSDGSTALVGAYRNDTAGGNAGAAYILEKPSGGWSGTSASDATARFTGGAVADYFGYAVALSPDGSTALVGAYRNDTAGPNAGAAYIFERGRGWTSMSASEATARFTGGADGDLFGNSVTLSSDGSTALVGAYYNGTAGPNAGAAYIFEKGRGWTSTSASEAAARFTGGADNDFFGYAVTLSSEGSTALVGAYYNDTAGQNAGAAYVFEKGRGWTSTSASEATARFTGGAGSDNFGNSASLSSDGSTALVGAYYNDTAGQNAGAAYVFEKGLGWTSTSASEATARFTGGADNDFFGYAVTLSSEGSTALVGAYYNDTAGQNAGAAYVFERGRGWTSTSASDATARFTGGAGSDYFGNSASLSSDGSTALVGAYNNDTAGSNAGAAYLVQMPPTFESIVPASGSINGGTPVTITGTNFIAGNHLDVTIGGVHATGVTVNSLTRITATTPASATAGATWVNITNGDGQIVNTTGAYTYTAPDPVAAFSGTPTSGTVPLTVTFTDASTCTPTAWNWSFGDGTFSDIRNPSHIYTAAGSYTVILNATNATPASNYLTKTNYITVSSVPVSQSGGESDDERPLLRSAPVSSGNLSVHVGGTTTVTDVTVTGTGIDGLIVTSTEASGPGNEVAPPPGIVYEYLDITPARYTTITGAQIAFTVPQSWLDANHLSAQNVVLYQNTGKTWQALPTTFVKTVNGNLYFTATSPGFSRFAITGQVAPTVQSVATPAPTVQAAGDIRNASATAQIPTTTPVTRKPVAVQTTAPPAAVSPAPGFPLAVVALVGAGCLVLIGGGFLVRRWCIRRQNPALFKEYR